MKLSTVVEFDHCPMEHGTQAGFWLAVFAQHQDKCESISEYVQFFTTRPTARQIRKAVKVFYSGVSVTYPLNKEPVVSQQF